MAGQGGRRATLGRRTLMKLGVASGMALLLTESAKDTEVLAGDVSVQGAYYYGIDGNTNICCGMPLNFYLGRGGELHTADEIAFNRTMAQQAGFFNTHIWWFMHGPGDNPDYPTVSDYTWGYNQAESACHNWYVASWKDYVGGHTIFADIEYRGSGSQRINYGWIDSSYSRNRQVLKGFLDRVNERGFTPGIYTRTSAWKLWFGTTGYRTPRAAVLWIGICQHCAPDVCPPCSTSCWTTIQDVDRKLPGVAQVKLGGNKPVLWQYWLDTCGCGDYDASLQSGYSNFTPRTDATNYFDTPCPG